MYSKRSSSPMYTTAWPDGAMVTVAPSCLKRPSAVRFTGLALASKGSISTTQPKRLASFGFSCRSKRKSSTAQL
ncbi:hypothetical protein D3C85_1779430 [compost metagenome]